MKTVWRKEDRMERHCWTRTTLTARRKVHLDASHIVVTWLTYITPIRHSQRLEHMTLSNKWTRCVRNVRSIQKLANFNTMRMSLRRMQWSDAGRYDKSKHMQVIFSLRHSAHHFLLAGIMHQHSIHWSRPFRNQPAPCLLTSLIYRTTRLTASIYLHQR